jgi:glycosyltransferase involved in cell wall biosynthesis
MSGFTRPPALPTDASRRLAVELASDLLGPVTAQYLLRLDAHVRYATRAGALVLFVSRAGVRIRRLYHEFLAARGLDVPGRDALLWTSRCLTAKAVWSRTPEAALRLICAQFPADRLRDVCAALLRPVGGAQQALESPGKELEEPASWLQDFLRSRHPLAKKLIEHLQLQGSLFERLLVSVAGTGRRVVLVDSGWQGTSQKLLAGAYPEIDWSGLYFGTMRSPTTADPEAPGRSTGLMFDSNRFDPDQPLTAFVLYRHLVEGLFEPAGGSVEHLEPHAEFGAWAPDSIALQSETPTIETDPIFCAVRSYIRDHASTVSAYDLENDGAVAMSRLGRILAYPSREQALALGGPFSSMDFGRAVRVPVLSQPGDPEQSERRIRESLWPHGQIALEYPGPLVASRQRSQLGLAQPPEKLFQQSRQLPVPVLPDLQRDHATVAVIVRTVDRPLFLRRALLSVGQQTFNDYICVVVCDAGDFAAVSHECRRAAMDPRRLILIDNRPSRGIEAASNGGIRRVTSEFVTIHDDDDTWEPDFLQRTVCFLRGEDGAHYGGVTTWVNQVSEVSTPVGPVEKIRHPFPAVDSVQFMELACGNLFPPIAFLFRREIFDRLSGYDETLPVLGDWDFNLRFLLAADIGVIHERLANYHHRDLEPDLAYGNSVIVSQQRHAAYDVIVRNKILRSAIAGGRPDGTLTAMARMLGEMYGIAKYTRAAVEREAEMRASRDLAGILRALSNADSACMQDRLNGPWYLKRNDDVVNAGVDPVAHWFRIGAVEGRLPTSNPVELARDLLAERESRLRVALEEKERELQRCRQEALMRQGNLEPRTERIPSKDRE